LSLQTWRSLLVAAVMLAVVLAVPVAQADVIQPTPSLPPQTGAYTTDTVCFPHLGPGVCIVGASLHGFTGTTSTFDSSGQSIDSSISLTAAVYTDVNGMPGTFIASVLLQGPIGILYVGRMNDMELGTFTSNLTELDLQGTFHGVMTHTIEIVLNPNYTSTGPTTVEPAGGRFPDGEFQISSFFDLFAELSLDGGQFMPAPSAPTFTLTPTPEPGSISLLALAVVGVLSKLRPRLRD
jgi:hypothetical protein